MTIRRTQAQRQAWRDRRRKRRRRLIPMSALRRKYPPFYLLKSITRYHPRER